MRWRPLSAAAVLLLCGCEYPSQGPVLLTRKPAGVAGGPATVTSCDATRDLVCLDFEDATTPLPALGLISATGTGAYDSSDSAVGQQSAKISVAPDANYVLEVDTGSLVSSGSVSLRGLFRLPAGFEPSSYVVLMEALNPDSSNKVSFDLRPQGFGVNAAGTTAYPGQVLPRERWFCAELTIDVASLGAARLAIDGAASVEVSGIDTTLGSGLAVFRIGVNGGPGNPPLEINVDDFVVRSEPIGCP